MNLLEDLRWRGLLSQSTDEAALQEALKKPITLYIGFDPTAPSLHVGNLVVLLVLRRFQLAGHNPIALVGGATGLVGDPSGRNEERTLNSGDTVAEWVTKIRTQVSSFLDFDKGPNKAQVVNNLDWTSPLSAIEFLRDIGKHFSVNQMLAKDSVSSRLEAGGISYTEFSYQVLQSLDFLELYRRYQCTLQLGGSDQWGNIVAGLDLIRRVEGGSGHALTIPLLTKTDGSKFGKTASGSIWLDAEEAAKALFGQGDLATLDEPTLSGALSELPRVTVKSGEEIPSWVDLLAATGVVDSKSAARRIVKEGGAYLNNAKVESEDFRLQKTDFLCGKYALLRKGKRDLAAVELI